MAVAAALGTVDCKTRADAQAVGEALISQGEKLTGQTNNKKEAMVNAANAAMLSVAFLKGKSVGDYRENAFQIVELVEVG